MSRPSRFLLRGRDPYPVEDLMEWAVAFETLDRRVARTEVGGVCVSTVFLGLDHNFGEDGPPLLFESAAFDHCRDVIEIRRYPTWADAEAGHAELVAELRARLH